MSEVQVPVVGRVRAERHDRILKVVIDQGR